MKRGATLEYAHPQAPAWRRRLWWLTPLALVAAIATIYVATTWLVPAFERWQDLRKQKGLMGYSAPVDQVVFENDPAKAARLVSGRADYVLLLQSAYPSSAVYRPREWQSRPAGIASMGSARGFVFLHGRTSRGGNLRLVVVECEPPPSGPGEMPPVKPLYGFRFQVHSVRLGTLKQPPSNALSSSAGTLAFSTSDFRVFAGQPDPADPSHFTIDYEADGARGTIDGWLNDDDTITLKPRPPAPSPVSWSPR